MSIWMRGWHDWRMVKIQIRNITVEVPNELAALAVREGKSMEEFGARRIVDVIREARR
jgi:hypothetical protein